MAQRHLSRSIVLQSLFEWDFRQLPDSEIGDIVSRNAKEFAPGMEDEEFVLGLTKDVLHKRKVIDEIIEKAAPDWPLPKINVVDRNILRIGLFELLFGDRKEVPPKVAINEAIELAKNYGGENSGRFINGVLGAIYKEIGEPGKDEVSKKKKDEPIDLEKLPIEKKAGAVVYAKHNGQFFFAMVHDIFGYWTLSKGGVEEGETSEEAVVREIKEEIGLDIKIVEKLGENEYIASHPEKGKIRKQVTYFLGQAEFVPLVLEKGTGGLTEAKWFPLTEIADLEMYDNVTTLLMKSVEILTK